MKTEKIVMGIPAAVVCAAILILSPVGVRAQAAQQPAGTSDSQAPITSDPVVGHSSTAPPPSAAKPGTPASGTPATPATGNPAPAAAAPPPAAPKPAAPTPVAPKPTAVATPTSGKGAVVEDVIAHVN